MLRMKISRRSQLATSHLFSFGIIVIIGLLPVVCAHSMEPDIEEIETLDVIEITGAKVEQTPRNMNFSHPSFPPPIPLQLTHFKVGQVLNLVKAMPFQARTLVDQTAKTTHLHSPVRPLKTDRPLYPRRAREQGWHGRTSVQLKVLPTGTVASATILESSGYQLLDDNAIKAAKQWTFRPAKNGGFPVSSTVNIPIQFDLVQ